MANTKVTGDLIASLTIATGNIANNAITSDKISGLTTAHITEGANLYYTDARARGAVSVSGNALSYNSSTGVITSNFEESPTFTGIITASSSSSGDYVRLYGSSGTGKWDIYGNGANLRISDNESAGILAVDTGATFGGNVTAPTIDIVSTSVYQAKIRSTGAQYLLIGSTNAGSAGIVLDGDSNGDGAGGDYSYLIHEASGVLKLQQDSPSGTNELHLGTAGIESRLVMNSSGNVGINETSLTEKLEVNGAIVWKGALTTSKTSAGVLDRSGDDLRIRVYGATAGSGNLVFRTGGGGGSVDSEAMRLTSSGNVGIGTTSPQNILHLKSNDPKIYLEDGDAGTNEKVYVVYPAGSQYVLQTQTDTFGAGQQVYVVDRTGTTVDGQKWYINNTPALVLDSSGDVGIGTTSPVTPLHVTGTGLQDMQAWFGNGFVNNASYHYSFAKVGFSSYSTIGNDTGAGFQFNTRNSGNSNWMHGYIYQPQNGGIAFGTGGAGTTSATERMRIDSSGNVAIQTSGADDIKNFTINSSNGSSQVAGFVIQNDGANGYIHFKAGAGNATPSTKLTIGNAANSGNVGIGTTSPWLPLMLQRAGSSTSAGADTSYRLCLSNSDQTNNNYALISFTDGDGQPGSGYMGLQFTNHSNNYGDLVFGTRDSNGLTERMRIEKDGTVRVKTGSILVETAGQGIYLGGTATANNLDDYEEGTWTPQVYYQNSTDQANATNVVQQGKYTKIGNLVFVSFRLDFSQSGTPANDNIGVKNLPFAGANNHYSGGGNVVTNTSFTGLNFQLPGAGSTQAVIVDSSNGGNYGDDFGTGSGKYIRGSFTYQT